MGVWLSRPSLLAGPLIHGLLDDDVVLDVELIVHIHYVNFHSLLVLPFP